MARILRIDEMMKNMPFFDDNAKTDGSVDVTTVSIEDGGRTNAEVVWNVEMKKFYLDWCEAVATVVSSESDRFRKGDSVEIEIGWGDGIDEVSDFIVQEFERTNR